jgi:uncharacterized NAD(P)/FAD-binding protein YdhS
MHVHNDLHNLPTPVLAVLGAGFSGAVAAARALESARYPLRVLLINRSGRMARGAAYGTRTEAHVLNVPAGRMNAYPEDEDDFLRYAQAMTCGAASGAFLPRRLYGEYLEWLLERAIARARLGVVLERIVGEAVAIEPVAAESHARTLLSDCSSIRADRVLAVGNYSPADPEGIHAALLDSHRYAGDPWRQGALEGLSTDGEVVLLGTGLTMIDAALSLHARGLRARMHAVSRRGLLPISHRVPSSPPSFAHRPPHIEVGPASARAYLHSVRRHVALLAMDGIDWREVIGALRPITPALLRRLPMLERLRLLRHVWPYWEVHRHRIAPGLAGSFARLLESGGVQVHAARILEAREHRDRLRISIRRRGSTEVKQMEASHLINCTRPQTDIRRLRGSPNGHARSPPAYLSGCTGAWARNCRPRRTNRRGQPNFQSTLPRQTALARDGMGFGGRAGASFARSRAHLAADRGTEIALFPGSPICITLLQVKSC